MEVNQFSLLKTQRFLPLFITQFLGSFNGNAFKNALIILITYRIIEDPLMSSQILVSIAAGIFVLPFFLFSATAGLLADKFEKTFLISLIKFSGIWLMLLAYFGFYSQNVLFLLLILFLIGTEAAFFGPIKYAILPSLMHKNELIASNGLIEAGTFLSILLGTITGGILILHPQGHHLISVIIGIIALLGFMSSLFIPKTHSYDSSIPIRLNFFMETFHVIQYSIKNSTILTCILSLSWFWSIGAIFIAELPIFAKEDLMANHYVVTFFFSLFSIGIAMGSMLCNQLLKGKIAATHAPIGALGMAFFIIDLYFAASHRLFPTSTLFTLQSFLQTLTGWRITFDLLLLAICGGLYTVPLYTLLVYRTEAFHRARVIASNNILNALFMVITTLISAVLLKYGLIVKQLFLLIAVGNILISLYLCKLLPKPSQAER